MCVCARGEANTAAVPALNVTTDMTLSEGHCVSPESVSLRRYTDKVDYEPGSGSERLGEEGWSCLHLLSQGFATTTTLLS